MNHRRSQAGFTLIELMIAMVVSAIVVLGVYAFSSIQQAAAIDHGRRVRVHQALEGAMDAMARDVRQAGLGFARSCSELRVFDARRGRRIDPGGADDPSDVVRDAVTTEPYWVLRDGLQAHWNSEGASDLVGSEGRSGSPDSAADSFDVILAEGRSLGSVGTFVLAEPVGTTDGWLVVETSAQLDNLVPDHLAQVQQLFVPGSFILVTEPLEVGATSLRPEQQRPCALLQLTGDVVADPADAHRWRLPIDGSVSGFDADVAALMDEPSPVQGSVVSLGRLRWSRYELDTTIPTQPYLVRHDLIGYREGVDPAGLGSGPDYPSCAAGHCVAPQLHLPGDDEPAPAVAVGPMIEDLQVAVGCDGWSSEAALAAGLPPPDPGYEELDPNTRIDESPPGEGRDADEWLGNARSESWAPDCVLGGSTEVHAEAWALAFRMSPQAIRLTLVGSAMTEEAADGLASPVVLAVEDRPAMTSSVGRRVRATLTESFVPRNLRWRDPTVP